MNKYAILFIVLGVIITFVLSFFIKGIEGISAVIGFSFKVLIYVVILAMIGLGIWFLLWYEKKINATVEVFKNIQQECTISKPDNLRNLWLSGDKEHKAVKIGKISGFSCRQNYKDKKGNYVNESCFLIKRGLLKPSVIIRCADFLHDELQGDVKIFSNSLVKHALFYYPNVVHLDFKMIDKTIFEEGSRFVNLDYIGIMSPLVKKGIGLTVRDLQEIESKTGMDMVREAKEGK